FYLVAILIVTFIFVGIPLILIWVAYKFLRKKASEKTSVIITSFLILVLFYFLFIDFYPTDKFYFNDYKENTSLRLPDSAELINKRGTNSIYDFGDYSISYAVRLTPKDYKTTYTKLLKKEFKESEVHLETSENDFLLTQFSQAGIANILVKDYGFKSFEILFMDDGRTIIVNSNKW
ncbi:hypothetical protein DXT99_26805, partial [Pontibacter diazotrophicus]